MSDRAGGVRVTQKSGGKGKYADKIKGMASRKKQARFHVIFRPEPEGGFTAVVPALPGCVTHGRTLSEARRMAGDAIAGYVASLKKHGESIPTDEETLVGSLDLTYAETARR